ncbi:DUF3263 domain-containing protein [Micromonospora craniellae]|uniref:DUF3263 domain-containing protein n=1 Tax=Micromonospora craniellae TaxID=2294034 RepID=A0A372FWS2_9ACTN|nr:DUF3263 domain-containing protein [Micromonospora craniellae]QOC90046.1 DUF3263 domain-containing protein [Micromonospora craniellae]RFS45247.1 DUF3263 domain-containing protein [Micromonospora craniellae]
MQPADAAQSAETAPDAVTVPPPRSAPEVESTPAPPPEAGAAGGAGADLDDADEAATESVREAAAPGLGERDREILAFERQWWRHAGAKEQAIRDRFGLSATRYYQLLNALLDSPAALAADPVLVGRLVRLRASRARNRRR